ncbi:uncharacterized protein LOC131246528 [Magnolia sinica]|uniref:uncharacterized protein LOC131246528 n=1 Tax=Magnolia sinica TaxID=86752 RepID=UPI00265A4BB7|nr:uncharacterized protein LOC131246528 [Magnolia sinica]XP_058102724.1 uncharacterized protein LOC131246528 [Magnolia sinica]XP_058102725.1 uncharacterized protein LOC131246528 [Magnolia sinica]XP_058102726.1 uncharacterized protein LOC131246528 [Magnolia sinica]
MASLLFHILASIFLFSYGIYHLLLSIKSHFKSPSPPPSKPYHPFPSSSSSHFLKHLPLYLILSSILLSILYHSILSSISDPLAPVHRISSLQSVASLLLFLLLCLSLLISSSSSPLLPLLPSDLIFCLASIAFAVQSFVSFSSSSLNSSILQSKCDSVSSKISAASGVLCFALALDPRLFVADIALAGSLCLQGLWVLQTGLSLYADGFIPDGCHRLLDVVRGIEGSTKCDLEESQLRAMAILDLVFVFHVVFVAVIVLVVYAVMARAAGVRRVGSYEALPTSLVPAMAVVGSNHVQMKALTNTQA